MFKEHRVHSFSSGFRIRSDIDRIRIQPLKLDPAPDQEKFENQILIWIRIQTKRPDPDPSTSVLKFSIYFMMIFDKKLVPFSFFDGP